MSKETMGTISVHELHNLCMKILTTAGVPNGDASVVVDTIVKAELRGIESHGIIRFPSYVRRIQKGLVNLKARMNIAHEGPSFMLVDGDNGLGQVIAIKAIGLALEKAKKTGVCVASIFNTNYLGMLAYYPLQVVDHGMIGLILCNTLPLVAPTGGMEARIGTNPICFAIPTDKEFPIVLDMAISPPVGRVRVALQKGVKIPEGWALDVEGRPTTDPVAALKGVMLPIGGPKGYGLGLIVDILSGILSGANYGMKVSHPLFDMDRAPNLGNFILVLHIESFMPLQEFKKKVNQLVDEIKGCKKIPETSEIFVPGEIEFRKEQKRRKGGIPIQEENWKELESLASELQISLDVRRDRHSA